MLAAIMESPVRKYADERDGQEQAKPEKLRTQRIVEQTP
jgi:hypothetical protein